MAAAALAPPYHHRQPFYFLPPDSIVTVISGAWFLSRKTSFSSSIWTSSKRTRTSPATLTHCSPSPTSQESSVPTAESCVNLGLSLFAKGRVKDALTQFDTALTLNPNPKEAQAALYSQSLIFVACVCTLLDRGGEPRSYYRGIKQ